MRLVPGLVAVWLVACGESNRAVDQSAEAKAAFCAEHPTRQATCSTQNPYSCKVYELERTCMEFLAALPDDCEATFDDVIECFQRPCPMPCTAICATPFRRGGVGCP